MCHVPSTQTSAWSFTAASGSLRIGLRRSVHSTPGAPAPPVPPTTQSWSAPTAGAAELAPPPVLLLLVLPPPPLPPPQAADDRATIDAQTRTPTPPRRERPPARTASPPEERGRPGIDEERDVVPGPQHRRRARRRDRPREGGSDGPGLARFGHDGEDGPGPEERRDRGREGEAGDGPEVGEVALVDLLEPAVAIELDHLHVERVVEVGHGRVVEGEVPVLAHPET